MTNYKNESYWNSFKNILLSHSELINWIHSIGCDSNELIVFSYSSIIDCKYYSIVNKNKTCEHLVLELKIYQFVIFVIKIFYMIFILLFKNIINGEYLLYNNENDNDYYNQILYQNTIVECMNDYLYSKKNVQIHR